MLVHAQHFQLIVVIKMTLNVIWTETRKAQPVNWCLFYLKFQPSQCPCMAFPRSNFPTSLSCSIWKTCKEFSWQPAGLLLNSPNGSSSLVLTSAVLSISPAASWPGGEEFYLPKQATENTLWDITLCDDHTANSKNKAFYLYKLFIFITRDFCIKSVYHSRQLKEILLLVNSSDNECYCVLWNCCFPCLRCEN